MRMLRLHILLAFTVAALSGAAPASAQQDGVTLDPDSSAGKEYAIPLEAARSTGAGGGGGTATSGGTSQATAPLFGSGVKAVKSSGNTSSPAVERPQSKPSAGTPAAEPVRAKADAGYATSTPAPSSTLFTLGFAGAVLLIGLLAFLAVRLLGRRGGATPA
jgi:hypothetical protein